jgi:mannosyl-3-phosphoglycerate phosphatase
MERKLIIFTDLDGTLLDSRYSFRKALPALKAMREKHIALILCSSKTREEIEHIRSKLYNNHPFVSENGGGIFIPKFYYKNRVHVSAKKVHHLKNYLVINIGAPYSDLRNALSELRSYGFDVKGFGDMTIREVSKLTGLKTSAAKMAKERDFDEPFVFKGNSTMLAKLKKNIISRGLNFTRGEILHLTGDNNKGRAVEILVNLYQEQHGECVTAALGDSPNDVEMLERVDYPVVVKKSDGTYNPDIIRRLKKNRKLVKTDGIGPEGWNKAVLKLLDRVLV